LISISRGHANELIHQRHCYTVTLSSDKLYFVDAWVII